MRLNLNENRYYRLTIIACFFIAAIIVTGASVRVTGSGLGCPTWPKCTSESLIPKQSESGHAFVEFANRVFTGFLSLSVILAIGASFLRKPRSKKLIWLSFGLVFGVIAQIILGGITVLVGLHPLSVAAHMIVSLLLLSCAIILTIASKPNREIDLNQLFRKSKNLYIMLITYLVVVLGTVVTAAGPHAGDQSTPRLDVSIKTVARIHSLSAWLLLFSVVYLLLINKDKEKSLKALFAIIIIQGAWGYIQYALSVPSWMVLIHVFLATLLFIASSFYWSKSTHLLDSQHLMDH